MRNLLSATDQERLFALLRQRLARAVTVEGVGLIALAESEEAPLCDVVANARAVEFLIQPAIRDGDSAFADGVLDFVIAMAEAPLPCRRLALGGLEIRRNDPRGFEILTPFHRFAGDLGTGVVLQWLRGNSAGRPGTALAPLAHTGNIVQFHIGRHRSSVDAEDGIDRFGLEQQGDQVLLWHETPATGLAGLLRGRPVPAGRLRYEYRITGASPLMRLTVSFTASHALTELRLSTALDALSAEGLALAEAKVQGAGGWRPLAPPSEPALTIWAEAPPVAHVALGQAGWPEGAPTVHLRPTAPGTVKDVKAVAEEAGALHWLVLRHGPADLAAGEAFSVSEDRLLAAGTSAEAAAQAMLAPGLDGTDLEPLSPSGAALLAVASQLLLDSARAYRAPLAPERRAVLADFFDRHLAALLAGTPAVEDLALALAAVETRLRDGAALQATLEALAARLGAAQGGLGGFGAQGLPAHAAAILALARVARRLPDGPPLHPLGRAIRAIQPQDFAMAVAGAGATDPGRHAEGLGMLARALGAVLLAVEDASLPLGAEEAEAVQLLHRQAIGLLRPLVQPYEGMLEVRASMRGGGATPGSQAAVALGLMAPESLTMRLPILA